MVTIGECVRLHIEDEGAGWKDFQTRVRVMDKYAPEYENQDAMELYEWSVNFIGYMRSNVDRDGRRKKPMSDKTISNTIGYIRAAIKYAYVKGKIEHDETGKLVVPSVSNERHVYRERKDMLKIARACRHRETRAAISGGVLFRNAPERDSARQGDAQWILSGDNEKWEAAHRSDPSEDRRYRTPRDIHDQTAQAQG